MSVLPKEIAYNRPMASLPADTSSLNVIVRPSNGATFSAGGDIIQFDLPAHSFLVPSSLTLRGKVRTLAGTDGQSDLMWGVPAASWIQRVETIVGGNLIESVQSYGQLYNMIALTKLNVAEKYGLATELGFVGGAGGATGALDVNNLSGRTLNSVQASDADPFSFALPLGCLLSSCSELVPLGLMGGVRIQLTTAAVADYIQQHTTANLPTITFEDLELNFDLVSFGAGMDGVVASMANAEGDILMKSQGWNVNNINTSASAGGTQDLIFNTRLSSIKSLIYQGSGSYQTSWGDDRPAGYAAAQVAGATGSTQFFVASTPFPPTPLRETNQAAIMSELRQAQGQVHDVYSTSASISPQQFITAPQLGTASGSLLFSAPPAHFVGVNTEKLSTNAVMLSGVSSQLSPINIRLQSSSASQANFTSSLYCLYDAIISINIPTRTMMVRV
tara:strand:+ start:7011 stop:8348 length:1338 start_codon:yes stop_codon:yes gene_type:complete